MLCQTNLLFSCFAIENFEEEKKINIFGVYILVI